MTEPTSETDNTLFATLLASGSVLFVGLLVQLGLNFLTKVLVARAFTEAEYGAFSLGFAILTTLSILSTAGVDTGIGRFLPRFDAPSKRRGVLVSAFVTVLPVAVVVGIGTALSANYLANSVFGDPSVEPVIYAFALGIPVAVFVRLTIGSVRGMKDALPRVIIQNVSLPVVRLVLILALISGGWGIVAVSWTYAAAYVVAAGLSLYYLRMRTSLFKPVGIEFMHRELLVFSLPLLITTAMKMILSNMDTLVLGVFGTTADIGAYNVAYPLASLLTVALSAFGFVFMPVVSGLDSEDRGNEFARAYQVVSKWIFVLSFPLVLTAITFPEMAIDLTFGSKYERAGLALVVLAVGFFSHAISGPSGNALTALGKTRIIMLDNIIIAITNLVLNLILVPRFLLLGAATATAASYALLNVLYLTQLYRLEGIHPFRAAVAVPAVVGLITWVGLVITTGQFVTGPGRLVVTVVGFCLAYPVLFALSGGVEEAELWALGAVEDKLGVKFPRARAVLQSVAR